jgi:predicted MFS family arabinose efflux permease
MAAGLALPLALPGLTTLLLCPALVGLGHVFFHVSVHSLVGALSPEAERTRNFATFSLGISIAAFIGPSAAGFAIELGSYRAAFALLAAIALLPALYAMVHRGLIPARVRHEQESKGKSAFDLLAIPDLRRTLIMSGVALTGIELFSFYLPIYGSAIGLAPSVIGMILSSHAVAGLSCACSCTGSPSAIPSSACSPARYSSQRSRTSRFRPWATPGCWPAPRSFSASRSVPRSHSPSS